MSIDIILPNFVKFGFRGNFIDGVYDDIGCGYMTEMGTSKDEVSDGLMGEHFFLCDGFFGKIIFLWLFMLFRGVSRFVLKTSICMMTFEGVLNHFTSSLIRT